MGRKVRMVPADWEHPKDERGHFIPLMGGSYSKDRAEWDEEARQWGLGMVLDYSNYPARSFKPKEGSALEYPEFEAWNGPAPEADGYMPDWPDEQRTHMMMYEDISEGTPISPAFERDEDLARWLADNGASSFGNSTATYEQWLAMIGQGSAISMVISGGVMMSGVEFAATQPQ